MAYKLNNKATIVFKDGTISNIECSYVSYGKSFADSANAMPTQETVKLHGSRGVPVSVIDMSEIARFSVTDNPIEQIEYEGEFAEVAVG